MARLALGLPASLRLRLRPCVPRPRPCHCFCLYVTVRLVPGNGQDGTAPLPSEDNDGPTRLQGPAGSKDFLRLCAFVFVLRPGTARVTVFASMSLRVWGRTGTGLGSGRCRADGTG